jgi:hypothetical protein
MGAQHIGRARPQHATIGQANIPGIGGHGHDASSGKKFLTTQRIEPCAAAPRRIGQAPYVT